MRSDLAALLRGPVARGATWTFALQIVQAALTFLAALVLARILGPAEFGAYSFAIAWAGILAYPASLGFGAYLVRQVAVMQQGARWSEIRGLLRVTLLSVGLVASAVALGTWLLARANFLGLEPGMAAALAVGAGLIPIGALLLAHEGILRGLSRIASAYIAERLVRPASLLALVLAAHFLGEELTGATAVALNLVTASLALAVAATLVLRRRPPEIARRRPRYAARRWILDALPFTLLTGLQVLQSQIDVIMLGLLAGPEETGVYRAVSRTATLMTFGYLAVNAALAPRIAARHAAGQRSELQRNVALAALAGVAFALPLAVVFLVAGRDLLGLFGAGFQVGDVALTILTIGLLVNALAGPVGLVLSMTGHASSAAMGLVLGMAANIGLNVLLIPPYGIEGAAFATAASMVLWSLILAGAIQRKLGIDSSVFSWMRRRKGAAGP